MNTVFLYDEKLADQHLLRTMADFNPAPELPADRPSCIIRWGNLQSDDDSEVVLNRKPALKNVMDKEKCFSILKLNRIRRPAFVYVKPTTRFPIVAKKFWEIPGRDDLALIQNYREAGQSKADFFTEFIDVVKKYRAYVFDLKVFCLTKKIPVKSNTGLKNSTWQYEEIPQDMDADSQKVIRLAIRAVYTLGLDFGEVSIGINPSGRAYALDVNATPRFNAHTAEKFKSALAGHPAGVQDPQRIPAGQVLLGADPEFILRDKLTGRLIYPSGFLPRDGTFGYDERSERREGCLFPLAEIRPEPDTCPLRLVSKIRWTMAAGLKLIPYENIEWLAGSLHFARYQIGGHIHFGGLKINTQLLKALDNYLGIPVMLIEDPASAAERRKHYGGLGSFRLEPHGGFEYRTPGSWLVSPEIARAVLCLAKVVACESPLLKRDFFGDIELQRAFYQGKKNYFIDLFEYLWQDICSTETYRLYKNEMQLFPEMVRNRQNWNEHQDIRLAWKLDIPSQTMTS